MFYVLVGKSLAGGICADASTTLANIMAVNTNLFIRFYLYSTFALTPL